LELPLPNYFDEINEIIECICAQKDISGMRLAAKIGSNYHNYFLPCVAEGIVQVINKEYNYKLEGKRVLVIGRGMMMGKPVADLLVNSDCTVTIAHSKTANLDELIQQNDIIVSAVGKPDFFRFTKVQSGIGNRRRSLPRQKREGLWGLFQFCR